MKSADEILRFGEFTLDPANRRLSRGAEPVELGGRYFDALVMLASAPGQLISKDRLHDEVWRGVPVTDEALSQAIMALRKALGDDAARPRFIETVPRHGYRFVGEVAHHAEATPPVAPDGTLALITGGLLGAIAAGLLVGLAYGMLAAKAAAGSAVSLVMVLICVSVLAAMVSGLGIAGGIGLAMRGGRGEWWRPVAGGALGGLLVGGFASLIGGDTLRLLMGSAPGQMTGAAEGLLVGTAVGLAATRMSGARRHALAAVLGAGAGLAIVAGGGTLMAGSLASLVARFPAAELSMAWTGEAGWLLFSGAFEGAAFVTLVSAGMARGQAIASRKG